MPFLAWLSQKKQSVKAYNYLVVKYCAQCVPIVFSYDCESSFSYRWAFLDNLEPDFLPCLAGIISLLQVTLLLISQKLCCFLRWARSNCDMTFKLDTTSHTDLPFVTSFSIQFFYFFVVAGPPTLALRCIRMTNSKFAPPG